jgi:NitT/TauT family transport system ATP-binding protein
VNQPSLGTTEQTLARETAIRLEGVNVEFDGRTVLRDVDLNVKRGEFIAIIGPSGGGKSTLLRVIAGLLKADSGAVEVAGRNPLQGGPRPAVVFQDYRLLPWRTVEQNIRLPIELTGRGEVKTYVGMEPYKDLYPHQLSGGMKARVAIARGLAQDAEVLLLDEPFAALDALVRERFNLEMKGLHARTGKTFVLVTHSIREAVYLADRVVVLRDGTIETILETHGEGRLTAFTEPLEAELRSRLGVADSTFIERPPQTVRFPWEILGVLALINLVLIAWSWLAPGGNTFFPSPGEVWRAGLENRALLWAGALETLRVFGLGLACSLGIGVPLGYAMGKAKTFERVLSPFIVALQAVPTIVIAPLLVFTLGYGTNSRVLIATLVSLFPVLISTMVGVREVDRVYREVFTTIGSNALGVLRKLELPGALPVILSGLRSTVSLALIGTVVAELTLGAMPGTVGGLGHIVNSARLTFSASTAYAAVGALVVLGCALYMIVSLLEMWVLRYRRH